MDHEITLIQGGEPDELNIICSCGKTVWSGTFPVQWTQVSLAVAEHLRPQAEAMMKELLKMVSVKDIIKTVMTMRKK